MCQEKTLVVADALSRSPRSYTSELTDTVVWGIPASPSRMDRIKAATANDNKLQTCHQTHKKRLA